MSLCTDKPARLGCCNEKKLMCFVQTLTLTTVGGHSGTEWLPNLKQLRGAEAVNAKNLSAVNPFEGK